MVKFQRFRSFLAEPIIQMIIFHVGMIILVAIGILATERYARKAYFEPADREIENRMAQGKLAGAMVSMLKDISVDYRRLLACGNNKSIELYTGQIQKTCAEVGKALDVIEYGGSYTYVQLVNFYDKDAISEVIHYKAEKEHVTTIYKIDIEPKLAELGERVLATEELVFESIANPDKSNPKLRQIELQTEALLHRITENANQVFYDIRERNKSTLSNIERVRARVQTIVLFVNIIANFFVVGVALLISYRIYLILNKQRETEAQNRRLSTLVEQNPSAIVITDLDGTIEYVNPAFLEISGYEYDEIIGKNPRLIKSSQTPKHVFKDLWETITAGKVWSDRLCNRRKDGSLFYEQVVISPVRDAKGKIINFVSVKLDISKMVTLEEEQRRTHLSMKAIVDNLPLGVALVSKQKKIIDLNQEASRILGYPDPEEARKHFIGAECRKVFCDADFNQCPIWDGSVDGVHFAEKTISLQKDVFILKSVIEINYGGEDVLMEVFLDITDRKNQEHLLKEEMKRSTQLMEEARTANQVKSDFLANMSHEIRTPLNSILGMNQLLMRTTLNDVQKKYIHQMHSASKLLLSIINDILDFSKIEAGKIEMEQIDVDLHSFFSELKSIMDPQVDGKGVELKFTLSPELPRVVKTDPLRLNQILLNLLGNAVKFTHEGTVELVVFCTESSTKKGGTHKIRFEVRDTGIGIRPEHQKSLFQPFYQTDMSTTRKYGGTGLGLVISNRLANMLGGALQIESTPGEGSLFFLELELPEGDLANIKNPITEEIEFPNFTGSSILLAEDNEMNRQVAIGLLEPTGVDVVIAENGLVAVEKMQRQNFDLILMDLQMPIMDGCEAIRTIRRTHPSLPIIALSAAATSEDRDRAIKAGALAHVSKPIDQDELLREMNRYLRAAQASRPEPNPAEEDSSTLPSSLPGFDLQSARKRLKSSDNLLHKHLWNFKKTFSPRFTTLAQTLQRSILEESRRELHTLKGLAGTFGANRLFEAAIQLETEIKTEERLSSSSLQEFEASLHEAMLGLDELPEYQLFDASGPQENADVLDEICAFMKRHRKPSEKLLEQAARYLAQNGKDDVAQKLVEQVEGFLFPDAVALIESLHSDGDSE